ncbi:MAG TPA: aminotransferase class V-fold PLP-dependent enzyme [Ruminococcaceae bacterium]|nr:aminotransferase class V-fold PLP-dependent enzyme [Oscillospiraceae bacterium]
MIYFDNAATTYPKPAAVYQGCNEALLRYGANPGRSGHTMSFETAEMIFSAREKAAHFFHAPDVENVIFTLNCTMSINLVLKGLLKSGDHVIISDLEHNSVARPVETLKRRGVIDYSVAHVVEGNRERTLQNFRSAIRPNTVLIACTHASNVFGIRLPITELGRLCSARKLLLMVDAAQSAGVVPIDVQRDHIDFLCVASHKGLYAPMGTGLLITDKADRLNTVFEGGTGSGSLELSQPEVLPDKLESGTVNVVGIAGILYGIETVEKVGIDNIAAHEFQVVRRIYRNLRENRRVKLYTACPNENTHVPVLSLNVEGMDSNETVQKLSDLGFALRGGLHCAPLAHISKGTEKIGTARLCPSMFTTLREADALCRAIKNL